MFVLAQLPVGSERVGGPPRFGFKAEVRGGVIVLDSSLCHYIIFEVMLSQWFCRRLALAMSRATICEPNL